MHQCKVFELLRQKRYLSYYVEKIFQSAILYIIILYICMHLNWFNGGILSSEEGEPRPQASQCLLEKVQGACTIWGHG